MTLRDATHLDPATLLHALAGIIAADDEDDALARVAAQAAGLVDARCALVTYTAEGDWSRAAMGAWPPEHHGEVTRPGVPVPPVLAEAAVAVGPVVVRDPGWPPAAGPDPAGGGPWLGVPFAGREGAAGAIAVGGPASGGFADDDVGLLVAFAQAAAAALDRSRLVAALEDAQRKRQAFFGVISHELRTPITTIYGGSRVLRQSAARLSHDARQQLLEDVAQEAERLYRLVEDLLVLSRAERDAMAVAAEPILLQHLVARVVASEQQRWPRARFRVSGGSPLPPVMGDSTLVEQVLRNLLSNAAKYAGDAGPIDVATTGEDGWVAVRVLDCGPGVDPTAPEKVFELYYRAPDALSRAQGAGIGLYACRELIRAMGGSVWVRPRDGGGAEFGFRLPAQVGDEDREVVRGV